MFYLAHISDIHLTPLPEPSWKELFNKRITGYINWKKNRNNSLSKDSLEKLILNIHNKKPDHITVTGDLVNLALDKEFQQANLWLKTLGRPEDISLVLGNHDVYLKDSYEKACQTFSLWMRSDNKKSIDFPYYKQRADIAIIGACSAIPTPPFCAAGFFSEIQAQKLTNLLLDAKKNKLFRIILIHHPPIYKATSKYKSLFGIKRFQQCIRKAGAELILHGHTHIPTTTFIEGKDKKVPVIGVSAASQAFDGKHWPASYNWFEIFKENQLWHCKLSRHFIVDAENNIRRENTIQLF